jgi:uncharacterized protein
LSKDSTTGTNFSAELQNALEIAKSGLSTKAIGLLVPFAIAGNAEAQFALWRCFRRSEPVVASNRLAGYWLRRAAQSGHAAAQERLGMPKSLASARLWFQLAAGNGNAKAYGQLGYLYFKGLGVTQNWSRAFKCYEEGFALGDSYCSNNLGWFYERGILVDKDYEKAREFFTLASERGNSHGIFNLGVLQEYGRGMPADREKARQLYERAARDGVEDAQAALARLKREDESKE